MLDNENFKDFQQRIKEFENRDENDQNQEWDERTTIDIKEDGYYQKKAQQSNIYKQFSQLCIELKFLYVAITRAKKRVIIYDDYSVTREPIQAYWQSLGIVHVVGQ